MPSSPTSIPVCCVTAWKLRRLAGVGSLFPIQFIRSVSPHHRGGVTLRCVTATPYDALLVVSFGGPEKPADVVPFLSNVTAGRNIPVERLEEVGEHYYRFGGRSPINDQCRALLQALREDFGRNGVDLPIYWGNRNWHPYLGDTLARMNSDGVRRAICFITSAYASY